MGDPKQLSGTEKAYKVEGDPDPWWVSPEAEGAFLERARASGLRVTQPAAMGPLPGQHYGPEDPEPEAGEPSPGGRPLPKDWGVDVSAGFNEDGTPKKLLVKPVPPLSDVPSEASGTAESLPGGVPDEPQGPAAPIDGSADAGMPEGADSGTGPSVSRKALEDSRRRADDMAARADVDPDAQLSARNVNSPLKERPGALETAWRSPIDVTLAGASDEMAGLGGIDDQYALQLGINKPIDSMLRNLPFLGIDIPERVGGPPGTHVTQRPGEPPYYPPDTTAEARTGPVARTTERGFDAPLQGSIDDYLQAGAGPMQQYAQRDQEAFDAHPAVRAATGIPPAIVQSVAGRFLLPAASAAEKGVELAERAAPAARDFISRTATGAKDALFNRGNAALAAAQGIGHAEGPSPREWLSSAGAGAVGEWLTGAAMSPVAETLLKPFRWMGSQVEHKLMDPLTNSEAPLQQAARNAGAEYETFAKPAALLQRPLSSERGMRPGESMQRARVAAKEAGSAMPGERERLSAATKTAGALDDQGQRLLKNLGDDRTDYYRNPEGAKGYSVEDFFTGVDPEIRKELLAKVRLLRISDAELHGREAFTPEGTVNARVFDRLLDHVDQLANTHKAARQFGLEADYADLSSRLHEIRRTEGVFPGAAWTAENHAQSMREHEALKTQMGLTAGTKGVDRTPGGADVTAIDRRLSQGASPALSRATDELQRLDPQLGEDIRNWAGIDAQQKLMSSAEAAESSATVGSNAKGRPRWRVPDISPGMRAAGMQNLGVHSASGLRGGGSEAVRAYRGHEVTPEEVANLARLLGFANQTPADFQRLYWLLGAER